MQDGPIPKTKLEEVRRHLYNLNALQQELDKAESCGVDCQEFRERHQHLIGALTAILESYSPEKKKT